MSNKMWALFILLCLCETTLVLSKASYQNVYGNELQQCSQSNSNMALTGYTRSGSCIDYNDDAGSHHICIDVSSTNENFCTVTGQSDWCSSYMPCDNGASSSSSSSLCPVENWCVCQWAFASYIDTAGGCDYIQEIQCDAINIQALVAYANVAGTSQDTNSGGKYTNALKCIEDRCGIESSSILEQYVLQAGIENNGGFYGSFKITIVVVGSCCVALMLWKTKVIRTL
jgi:uncharacterized protein (DUF2237 family)